MKSVPAIKESTLESGGMKKNEWTCWPHLERLVITLYLTI
jgi:hypothetical protein